MRWAEVDEDKLGACMMDVAAGRLDPAARRARASMARFSRRAVADVLDALLPDSAREEISGSGLDKRPSSGMLSNVLTSG